MEKFADDEEHWEMKIQREYDKKINPDGTISWLKKSNFNEEFWEKKIQREYDKKINPDGTISWLKKSNFNEEFWEKKIQREYDKKINPDGTISWLKKSNFDTRDNRNIESNPGVPIRGTYAGECPLCHSSLVWREAQTTGELYRGCKNFKNGCRWKDRRH